MGEMVLSGSRTIARALAALRAFAVELRDDRRGVTAVEFAVMLPVLMILMAGLVDGSRGILAQMQVRTAAQSGADYARQKGWNATSVAAAVTSGTSLAVTASPAPTLTTGCVVSQKITATSASTCADGSPAGRFVTVSARAPFSTIMPWPGFSFPSGLTATAVVRVP